MIWPTFIPPANSLTFSGIPPPTDIREGAQAKIISIFPAESKALITPGIQVIQRAMDGNHQTTKAARII
jgi:hypothetical protein